MGLSKYELNYSVGKEDFKDKLGHFLRSLFAEFLGIFILVFFGVSAGIAYKDMVSIALTFGLGLAAAVAIVGHLSGGHVNPAVTIAFLVVGRISLIRSIFYVIAQCVGAVVGGCLIHIVTKGDKNGGHTTLSKGTNAGRGLCLEILGTMLLVLVIFGTTDAKKSLQSIAPLFIGIALTITCFAIGPYTGSSLNPARTLGTAVVSGDFHDHWIYWVGPILGGIIGAVVYVFILKETKTKSEDE